MRFLHILLLVAAVLGLIASQACARADEVYIYKGGPLSPDGITVNSWGSGLAKESQEKVFNGSQSVRITTESMYSGGRMDFSQPITLFSDGVDNKRYIVFTFFFQEVQTVDPAAGTADAYDVEPYSIPRANKIRFVFISDTGASVSAEEPTRPLDPDDNWVRVAVPLAKFKMPSGVNEFRLKRLLIFSDVKSTIYLGEIKLVSDDSPIKVDKFDKRTIAVMDPVFFVPAVEAGISSLKYTWDFDEANGVQPECTDMVGKYVYTKGGDFNITVTVSDVDGIKTPVTVKFPIEVIGD